MTGAEHILCWIENSQPHYKRLRHIEMLRTYNDGRSTHTGIASQAFTLAADAYREMTRGGDAYTSDQSPRSILEAAILLTEWELEQ